MDTISLRSLSTQAILGPDSWARPKPQPLLISLSLSTDTTTAAHTDSLAQSFSYGVMAKDVLAAVADKSFTSIDHVTHDIARLADRWPVGDTLRIVARAPKALLRSTQGLEREVSLRRGYSNSNNHHHHTAEVVEEESKQHPHTPPQPWQISSHSYTISGLRPACIIGLNPHERLEKQDVLIRIRIHCLDSLSPPYTAQEVPEPEPETWRRLVRGVYAVVEPSELQTLEALAALVAGYVLEAGEEGGGLRVERVTVGVEKPFAVTWVEGCGVEITRGRG